MRNIILLMALTILLTSCVNSQIEERSISYENGVKIKEKIKRHPAPHAVRSVGFGLKIGIDENKIPIIWFGILKREYIVGNDKFSPSISDEYEDINLFLGAASIKTVMKINEVKE